MIAARDIKSESSVPDPHKCICGKTMANGKWLELLRLKCSKIYTYCPDDLTDSKPIMEQKDSYLEERITD